MRSLPRWVATSPWPYPENIVDEFRELLIRRTEVVDPEELENVLRVLEHRGGQWRDWHRTRWDRHGSGEDTPLLRLAGTYVSPEDERHSWATLMSMRNVDADCEAEITTRYLADGEESHA
jgi:hypothetical protein